MPRGARIVIPGCPHHLTQRGNNRQEVFFVDDDRRVYLRLLAAQSRKHGLKVHGYCLMTNHVHLIATPREQRSLAMALGRTNLFYARYINRLHGRSGHLWQDRFFSCALDEEHYWTALCYVERNPLRAGMVRRAWEHPWSSAAAHCGLASAGGPGTAEAKAILDLGDWTSDAKMWMDSLTADQDERMVSQLRISTRTGRPLGGDSFLGQLETLLGRRLRRLPVGRPRRNRGALEGDNAHNR